MRTPKRLFFILVIFLAISMLVSCRGSSYLYRQVELSKFNSERYRVVENLRQNPAVTKKEITVTVLVITFPGPEEIFYASADTISGNIKVTEGVLYSPYFECVVGHEIGHIENGHIAIPDDLDSNMGEIERINFNMQIEADKFGAKLCGKQKMLLTLEFLKIRSRCIDSSACTREFTERMLALKNSRD